MRWKTKIAVPAFASLGYLIASFFIKIIPCQISPNIPNPAYTWTLCTLNPDKLSLFGIQEIYWGITSKLTDAYLISIGLAFLVCFLVLFPFARHKHSPFSKSKDKKGPERGFETY